MIHDFDEIINRRGTDSKKYSLYPDDVLPMWIADSDFKAPEPIIDALVERMKSGVYGYTPVSERLKRAGAKWQRERFGWEVDKDWVEFVPGVISGIISTVRALSHPGDNIVIQTPCYPPFKDLADHNGRHLLRNELVRVGDHYEVDFDDFEEKCRDPRTKIFILCNPQNPTGHVFTKEELVRLGEICLTNHVIVLADEIHQDIIYSGHVHISFAGISKDFERNTVAFMNPSKTFNLPGFRTAAFIAANPVLKDAVHDVVVNNKAIGENICGTLAFCVAYEECGYYADQIVTYLEKNRDLVEATLENIKGIEVIHAGGTYLLWLDCRGLNMKQPELEKFFVKEIKLGLNSGITFGPEGEGFMRLNIACPRVTVEDALKRICSVMEGL
ncbi:MAG: pyridoxal phosphate-dependent aminotransferase [Clostridiales bacterium]|nr:pyridoxal phosphate-dependent aminotransferase [Clostridiales bacterium]